MSLQGWPSYYLAGKIRISPGIQLVIHYATSVIQEQDVTVVCPVYNEQNSVSIFIDKLFLAHPLIKLIVVNDGSTDATSRVLNETKHLHDFSVLTFSRNFGKEAAVAAGLDHVNTKFAIPMDVDGQDPIDVIQLLMDAYSNDVNQVIAVRRTRPYSFRDWVGKNYSLILSRVSDGSLILPGAGDFRLMDSHAIESYRKLGERVRFNKGLLNWSLHSSSVRTVLFDRPPSIRKSRWSTYKLISLGLDGIFSFSSYPLRISSLIFSSIGTIFFFITCAFISLKVIGYSLLPGWTTLTVFISSTIMLISFGFAIISEALRVLLKEVKNRPIYVKLEKE